MTIIVDSKTVTSCICPECSKEVEIDCQFPYYTELEGVYFKANLQEIDCIHCFRTFYASEHGLKNIPDEFLVNPPDPDLFVGKMVKFHKYQDIENRDGEVIGAYSPKGNYKCTVDGGDFVGVEFGENKRTYHYSKELVYLSEK